MWHLECGPEGETPRKQWHRGAGPAPLSQRPVRRPPNPPPEGDFGESPRKRTSVPERHAFGSQKAGRGHQAFPTPGPQDGGHSSSQETCHLPPRPPLSFHHIQRGWLCARCPGSAASHPDVAPAPRGLCEWVTGAEPRGGSQGVGRGRLCSSCSPAALATPATACLCRTQQAAWSW